MKIELIFPIPDRCCRLSDVHPGQLFYYADCGLRDISGDDAGAVFWMMCTGDPGKYTEPPHKFQRPIVSLDGKSYLIGRQADRSVVVVEKRKQIKPAFRDSQSRYVALSKLGAGDIFCPNGCSGHFEEFWIVVVSGSQTKYISLHSGQEKVFDDDQKFPAWQGDAVRWDYIVAK